MKPETPLSPVATRRRLSETLLFIVFRCCLLLFVAVRCCSLLLVRSLLFKFAVFVAVHLLFVVIRCVLGVPLAWRGAFLSVEWR